MLPFYFTTRGAEKKAYLDLFSIHSNDHTRILFSYL